MSTRGLFGIRKNGIDKTTYNHCDSYPDWLGKEVAEFVIKTPIEELHKMYDNIVLVGEGSKVYPDQKKWCFEAGVVNLNVSKQSEDDWYCMLRELQGNLPKIKSLIDRTGKCYLMDSHEFIKSSLYCEYAYIINLDTEKLEFYIGFQTEPDETNRYGKTQMDTEYYPCKCIAEYPLSEITDVGKAVEQMLADEQGAI